MSNSTPVAAPADVQHKIEELIEAEEGAFNRFKGLMAGVLTALAVGSTLFHLYTAVGIVSPDVLRPVHVGIVLTLTLDRKSTRLNSSHT